MKPIELIKPGDPANSSAKINELISTINELMKISAGPGLALRQTHAGIQISSLAPKVRPFVQNFDGGTLAEMLQTQATVDEDNWERDYDAAATYSDQPVTIQVMTDLQYSNTTHKIQARFRTLEFDRGGNLKSISIEGDLVDITLAIACTAQL